MRGLRVLAVFGVVIILFGCNDVFDKPTTSNEDIILELWDYIDENYSFFDLKKIDWDSVRTSSLAKVHPDLTEEELFQICTDMTFVLKDGHVRMYNGKTTMQFDFAEGYDVNFEFDLIASKYLNDQYESNSNYTYGIINDTIGYLYLSAFRNVSYFDKVVDYFKEHEVQKVIIDIRNNGGGDTSLGLSIIEYIISEPALVAYLQFKNGEDRDAFRDPLEIVATPKQNNLPVKTNILINRRSYSASTIFSSMTQDLDGFQLIGQVTGGGGCGGLSYELPNGWVVTVPTCFYLDAKRRHIELGVYPDIEIENSIEELDNNQDVMLETAIVN